MVSGNTKKRMYGWVISSIYILPEHAGDGQLEAFSASCSKASASSEADVQQDHDSFPEHLLTRTHLSPDRHYCPE